MVPPASYDRRKYDHLTLDEKVDEALMILETLAYAFPDGPTKHREAHESWIEAKHAETKFWQELKLDIAKKGAWGVLVIVLGLIMVGIGTKSGMWLR